MLSRQNLHDYQNRAVEFIKSRRRCALFLDMGLGKTASTLTAVSDLLEGFLTNKVLVIAPLRVANTVWKQEAAKWKHLEHLDICVVTGGEKKRLELLNRASDITVINRENVAWLVKHYGQKWPFDMVVIDESSSFKSPSSQRFKALRKVLPFVESAVLLTGTPAPNSLLDLWSQIYIVDNGRRLGRTMTAYKQRFFESDYMGYSWLPRAGSKDKIYELLDDIAVHMSAEDYLELPERINIIYKSQLRPSELKAYKDFEREMFIEVGEDDIEAASAAILANKLLQFSNGAMYVNDNGKWTETHTSKLDALEELVENNPGETMLVAYNYKSDLERIKKRFPDAVVLDQNPETILKWNRGEIKMMLAHPASAGHGLNLQYGGSLCVWFGMTWSLELYQQFNARLHRQGQTKPTRIVHIVSEGTIDERVLRVLETKDATQSDLLKALK